MVTLFMQYAALKAAVSGVANLRVFFKSDAAGFQMVATVLSANTALVAYAAITPATFATDFPGAVQVDGISL
jgi:hypothetical protein